MITVKKFEIGDKCFYAHFSSHQQVWIECPECMGTGQLYVILGNKEEVSIECECCKDGYNGSPGKIRMYESKSDVWSICIEGMEIQTGQDTRYKINHQGRIYITKDDRLFTDEDKALVCTKQLIEEYSEELNYRLEQKVKAHKNWAWHVSYHRGRIRQAEKDLVYHKAALEISSKKVKK